MEAILTEELVFNKIFFPQLKQFIDGFYVCVSRTKLV